MFGTRSSVSHTSPLTPSSPSPYTSAHTYKKTLYVGAPYRRCHTQRPGQSSMMPRQIVSFDKSEVQRQAFEVQRSYVRMGPRTIRRVVSGLV